MKRTNPIAQKKVIIFDLDGTLTKSKSNLDKEMAALLSKLLQERYVAVTSGCSFHQFENQFLSKLPRSTNFSNLFMFPTCSASGHYYNKKRGRYYRAYSNLISQSAVKKIVRSFKAVFSEIAYVHPKKTYGPVFENRGSQLTFSALGQKAPLNLKQRWDPHQKKRLKIRKLLKAHLPEFEISIGGTTSIDVTQRGVDKTLCVWRLKEKLHVKLREMLFVGDALFKGGNDYIMKSAGIRCVPVSGPEETKKLVRKIIQQASSP
jgi:hypothetical protein